MEKIRFMDTLPKWKFFNLYGWLTVVLAAGLFARFWVGRFGVNYDFDSYRIVIDLLHQGKNVYASTDRYNYGPVWFNLLNLLDWLSAKDIFRFRHLLTGFLSLVDIGIFWVLWRRFGKWPAIFFFLNPISIIITGMHNQFDNFAILIGIWAVLIFGDDFEKPVGRRKFLALVLMGVSLMTKHVLFMFPLWLAIKQKGLAPKMVVLTVPVICFFLGFAPYCPGGSTGILQHVFCYSSQDFQRNFYTLFVPAILQFCFSAKIVWGLLLVACGFAARKEGGLTTLFLYLAVLVAGSPAMANQYLAIPTAFAAVWLNPFTLAYLAAGFLQLVLSRNELNLMQFPLADTVNCYDLAIISLTFALAWFWGKSWLKKIYARCLDEWLCQSK